MGVDAGIFAKKAKKYFWFDRLSNISSYWDYSSDEIFCSLGEIRESLENKNNSLSTNEIIYFLDACINAWELREESQRYHANWVRSIVKFVQAHPNDQFFVSSDSGDAYDLIGEMHGKSGGIWNGKYMEWKESE